MKATASGQEIAKRRREAMQEQERELDFKAALWCLVMAVSVMGACGGALLVRVFQ